MRTYGIFVAYSPTAKIRAEGLGRYLASFVKAATERSDAAFVIAVPSWSRRPLKELFAEVGVDPGRVTFVGPTRQPISLVFYDLIRRLLQRRPRRRPSWVGRLVRVAKRHLNGVIRILVGTRDPFTFLVVGSYAALIGLLALPVVLIAGAALLSVRVPRNAASRFGRRMYCAFTRRAGGIYRAYLRGAIGLDRRLYDGLLSKEMQALVKAANALDEVVAWYSPTSTLPDFNRIRAPKLMTFPDLVFREFPVAFAEADVPAALIAGKVRETVAGGQNFVTYSERIKRKVLVEHMGVAAERVRVVPHAPSALDDYVTVEGTLDDDAASESLCRGLAQQALSRLSGPSRGLRFDGVSFDFIFYASQFRPSKNVVTLLRAYEHLLRDRYIGCKLVLTGRGDYSPVEDFIRHHGLERDVLCVTDLSEQQLAAFYRLATLAVNPSLSEGGMPFTFTEALSVGTPVVMGDIEVTREILADPDLREATLFDPYDWRAVARKIEWALAHKDSLYARQRAFYESVLAPRQWDHVVSDHIRVLDEIAAA